MIILNPSVGVAPGTTTMQLGDSNDIAMVTGPVPDQSIVYVPYENPIKLRGLGAIGAPRWGLVLAAGIAAFSIMLGLRRWRPRR